jgi:hypothetical protein
MTPGMEDRRLGSTGDIEVREEDLSLVELLRCEEDLWRDDLSVLSARSLSCLDESLRSLRLSGLLSRILVGMTRDVHYAAADLLSERL